MEKDRKQTIANVTVAIVLFFIGTLVGKIAMENIADTWLMFNAPSIGILVIGELAWLRLSKIFLIIDMWIVISTDSSRR